ncbi:MAG: hypothetical protein ACI8RD_007887 [Bacillariaceae sp.]|jgi:hypothetical protein
MSTPICDNASGEELFIASGEELFISYFSMKNIGRKRYVV